MSRDGRGCRPRQAEWKAIRDPSKGSEVIVEYDSIVFVMTTTEALPDDPGLLKAMLLAERAESERLRQIIRELQRHRFGRRAESLPEEQLQFALEEAEQIEAAGLAQSENPSERKARAAKRRTNRGALPLHLPRIETVIDVSSTTCPGCSGTLHRIGED